MRLRIPWILAFLVCASPARGAGHSARLVYVRSADAETCADEEGLRMAVAKRLGYDPFVGYAEMSVIVDVRASAAGGFAADVRIVHGKGVASGARFITSPSRDCRELVDAVALTVSIAVDPVSVRGPATLAVEPALEPPASEGALPVPTAPLPPISQASGAQAEGATHAPTPTASQRLHAVVAVAAFASAGEAPAPAVGGLVHGSLHGESLSVGLEARFDLPSSRAITGSAAGTSYVRSHSASAWLVPCAHLQMVARAMEELDMDRRAVLVMHEVDDVPIPEIAESLGIALNTAYSRLRTARAIFTAAVRRQYARER